MVLTVPLIGATLPFAPPMSARYARLLLRRRFLVIILVQAILRAVGFLSRASTGVATHTRRRDATALVQQRVVVVRPQELAKANTDVWTRKGPMAIIAREVPL